MLLPSQLSRIIYDVQVWVHIVSKYIGYPILQPTHMHLKRKDEDRDKLSPQPKHIRLTDPEESDSDSDSDDDPSWLDPQYLL